MNGNLPIICSTVLGIALVIGAVVLLVNNVDGAARAILFAASATAFGQTGFSAVRTQYERRRKK